VDNCNNTIVVINTVDPRLVDQWIEHSNVTGVLYGGPLGQESGNSIDDVLFGAANPSGRLIHTIGKNESDYDAGTAFSEADEIDFSEGNYIDYKYFDVYNKTPRFEFGFGLSYTNFTYSSVVTVAGNTTSLGSTYATGHTGVGGCAGLWDIVANVMASITNLGALAGADVPQLYMTFPDAANEPARQLRGFKKVPLEAGSSSEVEFALRRKDLSIWDVGTQNWKVESGVYTFWLAASSRDLRASTTLTI
jgi:beta-glucosidase